MACEAEPNQAVGGHIGFEEFLSELIARARMLRPHLGSRLVSTLLAYGVRCRTLSCVERCGRISEINLHNPSSTPITSNHHSDAIVTHPLPQLMYSHYEPKVYLTTLYSSQNHSLHLKLFLATSTIIQPYTSLILRPPNTRTPTYPCSFTADWEVSSMSNQTPTHNIIFFASIPMTIFSNSTPREHHLV